VAVDRMVSTSATSALSHLASVGGNLLAEGRALQNAGDYVGARAKFNAHIAKYPSDGNAHHHLAVLSLVWDDYQTATAEALIASRLSPQDASVWNTLGEAYRVSGCVCLSLPASESRSFGRQRVCTEIWTVPWKPCFKRWSWTLIIK
jgi:tetratricopeptide (TPR) repeat protein